MNNENCMETEARWPPRRECSRHYRMAKDNPLSEQGRWLKRLFKIGEVTDPADNSQASIKLSARGRKSGEEEFCHIGWMCNENWEAEPLVFMP